MVRHRRMEADLRQIRAGHAWLEEALLRAVSASVAALVEGDVEGMDLLDRRAISLAVQLVAAEQLMDHLEDGARQLASTAALGEAAVRHSRRALDAGRPEPPGPTADLREALALEAEAPARWTPPRSYP